MYSSFKKTNIDLLTIYFPGTFFFNLIICKQAFNSVLPDDFFDMHCYLVIGASM